MDITSILNESSTAAEQLPKSLGNANIPIRNRTPWDAGGYSLPINTRSTSFTNSIQYYDPLTKSPRDSYHTPSDSHSSMSSFVSSASSTPHSRFSSTSTVSSFHQLNNIIADDSEMGRQKERCSSISLRTTVSAVSPSTANTFRYSTLSPLQSHDLTAHVQIVGRRLQDTSQNEPHDDYRRGSDLVSTRPSLREESRTKSVSYLDMWRPQSPSDAVLIKRSIKSSVDINNNLFADSTIPPALPNDCRVTDETSSQHGEQSRGHKRAISAPDVPRSEVELLQHGFQKAVALGPIAEPTPTSSLHPDHSSPTTSILYTDPNTPSEVFGGVQDEKEVPRCMYITNCDTGSQPRKAVSHIFGRNKMCTRLIPKMVWVYYCRKHYQRTRYRNAKEYVKLQYELVVQQIMRLQDWSEENVRIGSGGIVKDWSIAIRKREQKRLDDQKVKNGYDNDDSGEEGPRSSGDSAIATAVPEWLLDQCGRGYSTPKLMEIINHLGAELMNGTISVFPDIEILPNIVVDQEEAQEPEGHPSRKSTIVHQRSQSLGEALRSDNYPRSRSMSSQPSLAWQHNTVYNKATLSEKKRKRYEDNQEDHSSHNSPRSPQTQRPKVIEYPIDARSRVQQFARRSAFPNIKEHQSYEGEYGNSSRHDEFLNERGGVHLLRLSTSSPPRQPSHSLVAQLQGYGHPHVDLHQPMHKRSQSDMSDLYNTQHSFRFLRRNEQLNTQPQYHGGSNFPRYYSPPLIYTNTQSAVGEDASSQGHTRYQMPH